MNESKRSEKSSLRTLPIVPLRGIVPLPGMPVPLAVGRAESKAAIDAAMSAARTSRGSQDVFLVMQRSTDVELPGEDDLHRMGVVAHLLKVLKQDDESLTVVVYPNDRATLSRAWRVDGYLVGDVLPVSSTQASDGVEVEALVGTIKSLVRQLSESAPSPSFDLGALIDRLRDPGAIADAVAAHLALEREEKQEILETVDVLERLRLVSRHAGRAVEVMDLSRKIESEVHGQIEEHKRQALLREQLRAIRKELGEEDDSEVAALREKLTKADLNADARGVADRELKRLESMGPASPERGWIVSYLEWLADLPWTKTSEERGDLAAAREILDREHFGLDKAKERILESLAVRKLRPDGRAPILLFVGPPGVGKTSLAQAVAEATGRELIRISVGGVSDESEIRGHRRTYVGALPGRILSALRKAGTKNPVFVIDEIDKMAASYHGDPAAALLEVLDPEQNKTFVDRYIEVPFDLSRVLFITTANTTDTLPRPLLDRMERIDIAGYTEPEKLSIARRHLLRRQVEQAGLDPASVEIGDDALRAIVEGWTDEAGVRSLERRLGAIARKLALEAASGDSEKAGPWRVLPTELPRYLGPRRVFHDAIDRVARPGVVMGLAWTPVGGEVLFVEAARTPGSGRLQLTGSLGEVMRESAMAALTWVRSHPERFPDAGNFDYHVHVPSGAIPKDGPSAGVAMLAALASIASGRCGRHDLAMTGEITLRGQVLPVGGIREKVLAAARAGVKKVLLPRRNEVDLEDVPADVRQSLEFELIDVAEQVLDHALLPIETGTIVPDSPPAHAEAA